MNSEVKQIKIDVTLDLKGLLCPVPVIKTSQRIKTMNIGETIEILVTDETAKVDFYVWCKLTGHELLSIQEETGIYKIYIKKSL
jgi:TusA-related sulfurtransferase